MVRHPDSGSVADVERYLEDSRVEAEPLLPALLDLSGPMLGAELARYSELHPGLVELLLELAEKALERFPERAHELTAAVIGHTELGAPPFVPEYHRRMRGRAWTAHASALRGIGRWDEAREAIAVALDLVGQGVASAWYVAIAEVVEAQILHHLGERDDAFVIIQHAASVILMHADRPRYVRARMIESAMHWDAGDQAAAAEVWRAVGEEGVQRGDAGLLALLDSRIGVFQLRHGSAEEAARRFTAAYRAFDAAGMAREAVRARCGVAEAAVASGRFGEAISEYYKVHALLLANGHVVDAAVAAAEILDLLLLAGRAEAALQLAQSSLSTFADAGLTWNALQAWRVVHRRAQAGALTHEDLAAVRDYFERLPFRPNAPFLPPEPAR